MTRSVYIFAVDATVEQDEKLIAEFNNLPNKNNFNGVTRNCADFTRGVINFYFPHAVHRDYLNDFGIESPKAVARTFAHYALHHPESNFRVMHFAQVPGAIKRSSEMRAGTAVLGKRIPAKPANEVTPDFIAPFSQKIRDPHAPSPASPSVCEAYREPIEQGLARGRNGKAIWQDLVSDHGFAGDYQAVKRFVRKLRGLQHPEAAGIILTVPGEEVQVDYGSGPMVRVPKTGKHRRTRLFVLTLGYSRKSVRLLLWRSSGRFWAELHEQATALRHNLALLTNNRKHFAGIAGLQIQSR